MHESKRQPRLVVGLGASAGGLEAFKALLPSLPVDCGMSFVLMQHLDPHSKSHLVELLTPMTQMRVTAAEHGEGLEPNTVYIQPAGVQLSLSPEHRLELSELSGPCGAPSSIDHFLSALAAGYRARAVGILLSGTGRDGTEGLRAIQAAGGLTLVQTPSTCGHPGMPRHALDADVVDLSLPLAEMYQALERFAQWPREDDAQGLDLGQLPELLEEHAHFDLRVYKEATVQRRIFRRIALSEADDLPGYVELVRSNSDELRALAGDLLIGVTEFFRDPQSFQELRRLVIKPLIAELATGDTLRLWVAGCATGEEVYSMAMELQDAIDASGKPASIQLFATDIDEEALTVARAGVYPQSIAKHVSEERLLRYFTPVEPGSYRVCSELRDRISFAIHDLTRDPPFSRMHLVSCRNVLIYLKPKAQERVLHLLHFSLRAGGHLILSGSESTGSARDLYTTVSKPWKIYRKQGVSKPIAFHLSRRLVPVGNTVPPVDSWKDSDAGRARAQQVVLNLRVPPTVIVSAEGRVRFMHGELGAFLHFPQGEDPRFDLDALLRPAIATRVRSAVYRCRRGERKVVVLSSPDVPGPRVRVMADPVPELGEGCVMLTFEQVAHEEIEVPPTSPTSEMLIDELEAELRATRSDLCHTTEALETANEELRASNEESLSMNEELQSANEELEATSEELRSLNEELTSVNAQLREKVEQVEETRDTLHNFFTSTKVATLFLDDQLAIKSFTPAASQLLMLEEGHIGRPIRDIARELFHHQLQEQAHTVLKELSPVSTELRDAQGQWYERSVLPFLTEARRVEGVVVTFRNVTALRSANEELRIKHQRSELAWEAVRGGLYEHRIPLDDSTFYSEGWAAIIGYRQAELPHYSALLSWFQERTHPDDVEHLNLAFRAFVSGASPTYDVEARVRHGQGHWVWVRCVSKAVEHNDDGTVQRLIGLMLDISEARKKQEQIREKEARFRTLATHISQLTWMADERGSVYWVNRRWSGYTGVVPVRLLGSGWYQTLHPDHRERVQQALAQLRPQEAETYEDTFPIRAVDGSYRWFLFQAVLSDELHSTGHWFATATDITHERRALKLLEADQRKDQFLAMLSHELRNPLAVVTTVAEQVVFSTNQNELKSCADTILRQAERMAGVLNDVLDLSQITHGKVNIEKKPLDVFALLAEIVADRSHHASESGVSLELAATEGEALMLGDRVRIAQCFDNVIGNALKFTPNGGRVEVTASCIEHEAVVRVCDTGIGIPPELLASLFEPFVQGEQTIERGLGGLGLGLSVTRSLIALHGGSVELHSAGHGRGTEAVLRLPLLVTPTPKPLPDPPSELDGLELLLVEDNLDFALPLSQLLERRGHHLQYADCGDAGLKTLQSARFDAVVCDIGLPDISGLEFARIARKNFGEGLALIAVSGYASPQDRRASNEAGFDAHLAKPILLAELEAVLAILTSRSRSS